MGHNDIATFLIGVTDILHQQSVIVFVSRVAIHIENYWKRLDVATVATFNTQNVATLGRLK